MKKVILLAALILGVISAQAQTTVAGSLFLDNWSFTLKGGAVAPLTNMKFGDTRGVVGVELNKQITPVFGLGFEGQWSVNTSSWFPAKSLNTFDHQYIGVNGMLNLMNAFAGYAGQPRPFEIALVAGTGWLHSFYPHTTANDGNSWATKVGLDFNFNLGAAKAWTLSLKPSILWNMNGGAKANSLGFAAGYDGSKAVCELMAGVTYHFGNSNGTHSFVKVRPYDTAEIEALNAQINELRANLAQEGANNELLMAQIADLQNQLEACKRRPTIVEKVVNDLNNIRYVFFNIGSSVVLPNQQPNLAMIADQLNEKPEATLTIQGYASRDGSSSFNKKLAEARAEVVKRELVKRYGISPSRIKAEGMGIGDLFKENSWNRVSVMTVNE